MFILGYISKETNTNLSDLVNLGILSKQISEFTDADIGTSVFIPYTDASGNITGPIEFEVVGVNHHKDVSDESIPTITLMSKNVLRYAAFDALEANNPLYDEDYEEYARAIYGNNRWGVSNIRQWLNSEGAAGSWYSAQHDYDAEPNSSNVSSADGAYSDAAGFLAGFSDDIKQHFATVRNKTVLCNADRTLLSKDFEETEDKVFLPSRAEMGYDNLDSNNPEGSHLAQRFPDYDSRVKDAYYLLRSAWLDSSHIVCNISNDGWVTNYNAYYGDRGVAPLLVLK